MENNNNNNNSNATTSPRMFWMNRHANHNNVENDLYGGRGGSPSPTRRSSIERLQKASRVKNSTMFAREQKLEYDPTRVPAIERPLAKVQGNAFAGFRAGHGRSQSQPNNQVSSPGSPSKSPQSPNTAVEQSPSRSPNRDQASPIKSSLSSHRFKSSCDSQPSELSLASSFDDRHDLPQGKSLHRHAKSVTFDAAPPQINEYEMATPDLSSVGTNSREGSFESDEDDFDDDYGPYPGSAGDLQDDSFDASLEDTAKTPVVGPDDWRQDREHRFSNSPMPESTPVHPTGARPQHGRTDSSTSSGEHRPLPPLPGTPTNRAHSHSLSSNGTSTTVDRLLGSPRSLPSPPPASISKSDLQNIGNGKMSLEERLKLMMLSDETSPKSDHSNKSFAEQQRERRMRRAGPRDKVGSPSSEHEDSLVESTVEPTIEANEAGEANGEENDEADEADEADDTMGDISGLDMDYELPSISRQSILNRVNGNKDLDRNSEYRFTSPPRDTSPPRPTVYDPDVPIASIEDSIMDDDDDDDDFSSQLEDSVIINRDAAVHNEFYAQYEDDDDESHRGGAEDDESHYSDEDEMPQTTKAEDDVPPTPRASTPPKDAVTNFSATLPRVSGSSVKENEFTRSLQSHMLPRPKEVDATIHREGHRMSDVSAYLQDSDSQHDSDGSSASDSPSPERSLPKHDYDGSGWGDPEDEDQPGTPDSVIHHPVSDDDEGDSFDEPLESPTVPEQIATIKASGSKLKTRQSATPSDIATMREARRQVSREIAPEVPPIPDKHRNRLSRDFQNDDTDNATGDDFLERHPSFKKRSLTLDLDLGLSLDQDFERVIEAQKVAFQDLFTAQQFLAASGSPTRQASGAKTTVATDETSDSKLPREPKLNANVTARKQRGYLMRQNTKVVTASDRPALGEKTAEDIFGGTRSAGNSPVKQHRPQSWTVEPWNGKARRSLRKRHAPGMSGPVPPLPGQESNTTAARASLPEEEGAELATDECGERGRLFVKVMGVKDLDLPLPKSKCFAPVEYTMRRNEKLTCVDR